MDQATIGLAAVLYGLAVFAALYAALAPVNQLAQEAVSSQDVFGGDPAAEAAPDSVFERFVRPAVRNILPQTPMQALVAARKSSKVQELLIRSGNPWRITPEEFLGIRIFGAIVGFFVALLLTLVGFLPTMIPLMGWLVIGVACGGYTPKVLLDRRMGQRKKEAERSLPEALDMLVITMNAGMNFLPALKDVVNRTAPGVVRTELGRTADELGAGKGLELALTDLARRAPSDGIESFCKAVSQGQKLGADITETLASQAEAARQQYEATLDERIAKLPTTLFLPIIGLMLPALMVTIMAPAFSNISAVL